LKNIQSIEGLDLLRIICIAAVIGIHCLDRSFNWFIENLSFAVPCFVMMSVYFSAKHLNKNSRLHFIQRRIFRLIPAFLSWTLIYAAARYIDGGNINILSVKEWLRLFFSGSAALHLYFIPMIFYYSIILMILPVSTVLRVCICLFGLIVAIWFKYSDIPNIKLGSHEADAFPFYFRSHLPFLFIGILIFDLIERINIFQQTEKENIFISSICGIFTLILWINPYFFPYSIPFHYIWQYTLLFLTFRFFPVKIPIWMKPFITVSFGIYLSHHIFSQGLIKLELYMGLVSRTHWVTPVRFFLCLIISAGFCILLEKKRQLRWMVI